MFRFVDGVVLFVMKPAQPRTDENGETRSRDGVPEGVLEVAVAPEDGRSDTIRVYGPLEKLKGYKVGQQLDPASIVARPWQMGNRSGISYRLTG